MNLNNRTTKGKSQCSSRHMVIQPEH